MNYALLMAHRRDTWLALARGYNHRFAATEIYDRNNRFGRYFGNGVLEILAGGDPVSREASGCVEDGWDWNRLDGTTVIYLPLDKLRAVNRGTEGILSDQTFVGGVSHRGRNGAFVMQIHGMKRHDPSFRARKSTFFFDDRIICLGSDIENDDTEHPTHTNLFQKHLPETTLPISSSEEHAGASPMRALPADRAGWLVDTGHRLLPARRTAGALRAPAPTLTPSVGYQRH